MNEYRKILSGFFMLLGIHLAAIFIGFIIGLITSSLNLYSITSLLFFAGLGIGIAQLVYVIPIVYWLNREGKWGLMKGVIIGAVITALLNGGCWLWLNAIFR